jgi:ketosteroid isomerase-like protein
MYRRWLWCVFALLSLGSASLSQAQQASSATEKAILELENQWLQSQKTNNPDLAAPLMADKYIETDQDGKVSNKAEVLASAKAIKFLSVEFQDMKVTAYGDTAIATAAWKSQTTDKSGKTSSSHSRWTDTWVKMPDGKWQCVASHGSRIEK